MCTDRRFAGHRYLSPTDGGGVCAPDIATGMGAERMKQLYSEIEINSSPARVWEILTDTKAFPDWNPFIKSFKGELVKGNQIEVRLEPPKGSGMTFKPTLLEVTPMRELRWLGRMLMGGIFDGEHIFEIHPLDAERVRFVQREEFNGILAPVFNLDNTKLGFEAMNRALKARAEAGN
jgi:hypothetical protein